MLKKIKWVPTPKQAVWELVFAASIWGFGFICTRVALEFAGPFWLNTIRFYLAFFFALPVILFIPILRNHLNWNQFWLAAIPGFLLSGTLVFQTAGLYYTSVTKSAFITVLYIIFVPFLERFLLGTRIKKVHLIYVFFALLGTFLICNFRSNEWNRGDLLTLICALVATVQIVLLEKISPKITSAFVFNVFQTFWAGIIPLLLALIFESFPVLPLTPKIILSILMLSFLSTLLAFLIQVRTQKVLPSSTVSMLFILESPFAALFAYLLLGETLSPLQWLGASLILTSALASVGVWQWRFFKI